MNGESISLKKKKNKDLKFVVAIGVMFLAHIKDCLLQSLLGTVLGAGQNVAQWSYELYEFNLNPKIAL